MKAAQITVGDRGGMGSAMTIMKSKGGLEMAQELGFDFVDFDSLETEDWVMIDPPDNHWTAEDSPLGAGFPFAVGSRLSGSTGLSPSGPVLRHIGSPP